MTRALKGLKAAAGEPRSPADGDEGPFQLGVILQEVQRHLGSPAQQA